MTQEIIAERISLGTGTGRWTGVFTANNKAYAIDDVANQIRVFNFKGEEITAERIDLPYGYWYGGFAANGKIYAIDNDADQIRVFNFAGREIITEAFDLRGGWWHGVFAADNKIYVIDHDVNQIRVFNFDGTERAAEMIDLPAGWWRGGFSANNKIYVIEDFYDGQVCVFNIDGTEIEAERISLPEGSWVDGFSADNKIYVTDREANQIRVFNFRGNSANNKQGDMKMIDLERDMVRVSQKAMDEQWETINLRLRRAIDGQHLAIEANPTILAADFCYNVDDVGYTEGEALAVTETNQSLAGLRHVRAFVQRLNNGQHDVAVAIYDSGRLLSELRYIGRVVNSNYKSSPSSYFIAHEDNTKGWRVGYLKMLFEGVLAFCGDKLYEDVPASEYSALCPVIYLAPADIKDDVPYVPPAKRANKAAAAATK